MPRVVEAGEVLKHMGAEVTVRFYPGMGHMVSGEEIATIRDLVASI
jgi:phospholipase/carboxylesterase